MDEEESLREWAAADNKKALENLYLYASVVSYHLGDMARATELASKMWMMKVAVKSLVLPYRHFLYGMIALDASNFKQRKYRGIVKSILLRFDKWVKNGCKNCEPSLLLLRAEKLARTSKNESEIRAAFDAAISVASKLNFLQHEALANERMGCYLLYDTGHSCDACAYLKRALEVYIEWGAVAKVEKMKEIFGSLIGK